MKASIWKAVFAAISPSPVFQSIAEFVELRADQQLRALLKQIDDANASLSVTRESRAEALRNARKVTTEGQDFVDRTDLLPAQAQQGLCNLAAECRNGP